ncbi:MAG: multidrug efflux pump subunit AcrB [Cellvibrionaceae bacterium]|jgi:multidrug efflux pump subunit AcrB
MKTITDWFIDNPIAANLLMVLIFASGYFYFGSLGKETFPRSDFDSLSISASYPGASPAEVEQQIIIRIEEAIADLEGIDEIISRAGEGSANITLEVVKDFDTQRLLNNVKTRIDALNTLPEEVDEIRVTESVIQKLLMRVAVFGNVSEVVLKETAQWLQEELLKEDAISSVGIDGTRDRELSIEVSESTLRNYRLSFDEIAAAVRQRSINLPAGTIKSESGNFLLQTRGQAYTAEDFAAIVVATDANNGELKLGQIADIRDGFAERDLRGNFNGYPAAYLILYTSTPPDIVEAAASARAAFERLSPQLPQEVSVDIWFDWSTIFESRVDLLLKNTATGLILVFVVLMLFLRPSLAMWVSVGISIAFFGTFWVMPFFDVTLNMISMYGFLLALGIVVDDAIIVGESVYAAQQRGLSGRAAVKEGLDAVRKPVIFAVVSSMIFFSAMYGLENEAAILAVPIATVVIICLFFSLVECLLILPSHLSHAKAEVEPKNAWLLNKLRYRLSRGMESFANNTYRRFINMTLRANGTTLIVFLLGFTIVLCLFFFGGYLKKSFRPVIVSSSVTITANLPEGVAFSESKRIQDQIEQAAYQLESDEKLVGINGSGNFIRAIRSEAEDNVVTVRVRLTPDETRKVNIIQIKDRWQQLIGPLSGVKTLSLRFTINPDRKDLRFRVSLPGNNNEQLAAAVGDIREDLGRYEAVYQIEDNLEGARTEYELRLKPYASALGLSLADIARQVRQGFYGEEIQRIPRGNDDIKVMLRYPASERRQVESIRNLYIRTQDERFVPLMEVADVVEVPGFTEIRRENRRRVINITAEVTRGVDSLVLANEFMEKNLPQWQQQYRGLTIEIAGAVADEREFNNLILKNFAIAFLVSFGLMAIIFRSYWQPVIILTAIPFGFVGAVLGHLLTNTALTMNSMLGFLACAGVVINDNLVLLDRIHYHMRDRSMTLMKAITQAGSERFRAIILTSLTTFVGLLPILSETSIQAQFMIPMVVSLAFGVLFATVVTLVFVPNLYLFGERLRLRIFSEDDAQDTSLPR